MSDSRNDNDKSYGLACRNIMERPGCIEYFIRTMKSFNAYNFKMFTSSLTKMIYSISFKNYLRISDENIESILI